MNCSRIWRFWNACVVIGWLCLGQHLVFPALSLFAQKKEQPDAPIVLEVKKPVEQPLVPGQKSVFGFKAKAGFYLEITVAQSGIDVVASLIGPDGKTLVTQDVFHDAYNTELLASIAPKSGMYRVEVAPAGHPIREGKFAIKLTELRQAVPTDAPAILLAAKTDRVSELWQERKLAEALALQKQITAASEQQLPVGHPTRTSSLNNLGVLLMESGQPKEAESILQNALAMTEKSLGPDHPETLTQLQNLGNLYKSLGKYPEAESCLRRALALSEKIRGPEDLETADCLNFLAILLVRTRNLGTAEPMFQRALAIRNKWLGSTHAKVGETLNNIGFLWREKGDYKQAVDYLQRALAVREQALGINHSAVAETLRNLAQVELALEHRAAAEQFYQRALKIYELYPDLEVDIAAVLNDLAVLYKNAGNYVQAEPNFQRALALEEKLYGAEHPETIQTLSNFATLYSAKGDYQQAESMFLKVLAIREGVFGPENPFVADTLNSLGLLYDRAGNYPAAEKAYQRALAIREKALGPDHPDTSQSVNNVGTLYFAIGKYPQAELFFLRALAIREKAFGKIHNRTATTLNNLGTFYESRAEYDKAEKYFRQALEIRRQILPPTHPDLSTSLVNLGMVSKGKGDAETALPLLEQALAIREKALGPNHADVGFNLFNLGSVYELKGDLLQAETCYQKALAIQEKALGPNHSNVALTLGNLASLYRRQRKPDVAEPLQRRALEIDEKVLGQEHRVVATDLNNLAWIYWNKGDNVQALAHFQRAQEIIVKALGPTHPLVATTLSNLAGVRQAANQPAQAVAALAQANDIIEQDLNQNLLSGSENQKTLYLKRTASRTDQTISLHLLAAPQDRAAQEAALTVLLRRKGRALDAMTNALEALRRNQNPEVQKLLNEYATVAGQISALTLRGPGNKNPQQHEALLNELKTNKEQLEMDISRRSVEFRTQTTPITLAEVQKWIPAGAVLVEYAVYQPFDAQHQQFGEPHLAAYLLNAAGDIRFAALGPVKPLEPVVAEFRQAIRNPANKQAKTLGRKLERAVFEPVRKLLGASTRVLLSPDGSLNLIPFDALVDERGRFLVQSYEFSYLTSGRDLLRLQNGSHSTNPPLALANPDYAAGQGPKLLGKQFQPLARLSGTAAEAAALKTLFPALNTYEETRATETALTQTRRPEFLHIGTHGYFFPDVEMDSASGNSSQRLLLRDDTPVNLDKIRQENPLLRSYLFFAGANHEASVGDADGILTALEAASLDLWGTKLVVLSACDTGLGDVKNGEGVYGLRRAFVLAGSESQLVSLWPVSDAGTRDLMVDFYGQLKNGAGRSAALRQIRLNFLKNPKRAHPYFWASFILSGEWGNLAGKR
ncbi:MAG: tetratricopeptide repeat protein [Blastocatellia bacterium]|nr:tetratricopeptide repeat protein [Blastocatellia bacterium]